MCACVLLTRMNILQEEPLTLPKLNIPTVHSGQIWGRKWKTSQDVETHTCSVCVRTWADLCWRPGLHQLSSIKTTLSFSPSLLSSAHLAFLSESSLWIHMSECVSCQAEGQSKVEILHICNVTFVGRKECVLSTKTSERLGERAVHSCCLGA